MLCNSAQGAAGAYTRQLADRLITDFPTIATQQGSSVDPASLAGEMGVYRNERTHAPLVLNADAAGRLRRMPDGSYAQGGTRWLFDGVANGNGQRRLRAISADGDTVGWVRAGDAPWSPTRQQLQALEGTYRSDEIGSTWTVKLDGDTLTLSTRVGRTQRLRPTFTDAFARGGGTVWFSRDRSGKVTAMHFSEARMWDLVLTRIR